MKWTKLKIHIKPEAVDALINTLMEIGIEGVEIEDQFLSKEDREAMYVNYIDEKLVPLEEYRVIVYLDETKDIGAIQKLIEKSVIRLREFMEVGTGHINLEEMPDEDYENSWKAYYKPFRIGENLIITPIWEEADAMADDVVIRIDPGMAFGSGTHETTTMCIEFIQEIGCTETVIDVGCGSGILGIVAAKLGATQVIGIDIDQDSVKVARENIQHNHVEENVTIYQGDLLERIQEPADVVVANILADIIIDISKDIQTVLNKNGKFIASGIIHSKLTEVIEALEEQGFRIIKVKKEGEWAAILATY